MSVVEELEARIDKISDDIELQKEVLRRLEQGKSAVQRQLNAIRDPVARLPLELSSEIFLQCALPALEAHTTLLGVCHAWTDIAVSTPTLWSSIDLDFPGVEILQLWLERVCNRPLSIFLGPHGVCSTVVAVLSPYAQQLQHLEIYEWSDLSPLNALGDLNSLETLSIASSHPSKRDATLDLAEILSLLRLTPNLLRCSWEAVYPGNFGYTDLNDTESTHKVTLPHLLSFGDGPDVLLLSFVDSILLHLSLPRLETLGLGLTRGFGGPEFALFLQANSPPLKKLMLGDGPGNSVENLPALLECFHLIPSLVHLEMFIPEENIVAFMSALAAFQFLPHLGKLKITIFPNFTTIQLATVYSSVLQLLDVRKPQLASFHLEFRDASFETLSMRPSPEIYERLRRLVAGGMEIFVGDEKENYLLT
ncbi:hypothetical protein C8R46DRAFT_285177 [Mycena filopes]|nr:hypothetical protein C8R46DRAFT_285177 [Mycena filopes]